MNLARRIVQALLILATSLVALVALALVALQLPQLRGRLADVAESQARRLLAADLEIGSLGGNLLFGATLEDVILSEGGRRVIHIDRVQVDYDIFDLLSGDLVFASIRLRGPDVRLDLDKPGLGLTSLLRQRKPHPEKPGRSITLRKVVVEDGTLDIEGGGDIGSFRVPERVTGLDLDISLSISPGRTLIGIDRLSLRGTSPELLLEQARGKVVIAGNDLLFDTLHVELEDSAFTLDGSIQNFSGSKPAPAVRDVL